MIPLSPSLRGQGSLVKVLSSALQPEAVKWKERGLHDGNVPNHFKSSWYLTRNCQEVS